MLQVCTEAVRPAGGSVRRRHDDPGEQSRPDPRRPQRLAWISLACVPLAYVAATLIGAGVLSLLGYDTSTNQTIPLRGVAPAVAAATLVFLVPCAAAVRFGRRAARSGARSGTLAAAIGSLLAALFVVVNVTGMLVGR